MNIGIWSIMFTSKLKNAKIVGNPNYLHNLLGKYSKCPEFCANQYLDTATNHLILRGGWFLRFDFSSIRRVMDEQPPDIELKAASFECVNFDNNYDDIIKHQNTLEYLYLSHIDFKNRTELYDLLDAVRQLKDLKFLFLRDKDLSEVPHNLPQTLLYLDLENNMVHDVYALRRYNNLMGLSLKNNRLDYMRRFEYYKNKYYKDFNKDMEASNIEYLNLSINFTKTDYVPSFLDNMKNLHTVVYDYGFRLK